MDIYEKRLKALFSDCELRFENTPFKMPDGAKEERIHVFRACRSGKCDRDSFLPTFEQQGYEYRMGDDPEDPGLYSLSVYEKPKEIKRFIKHDSDMQVPYKIAQGFTEPEYGLIQRTKERKPKAKSHIDWWLFKDKEPSGEFSLIEDFEDFLEHVS